MCLAIIHGDTFARQNYNYSDSAFVQHTPKGEHVVLIFFSGGSWVGEKGGGRKRSECYSLYLYLDRGTKEISTLCIM